MLVIVMVKRLSNDSLGAFTTLRRVRNETCEEEEMSSAIGIEKKAVTLTMGANEDAQVSEAL